MNAVCKSTIILRDEDPEIKMKLDYDPDKNQQTIILKQNRDNSTTKQSRCQVEDGCTRGKVKGVCILKPCFHRASARIDWKNEDYYAELWQVISGRVVNAYECIPTQPFWRHATNRVDVNCDWFWQDLIKSLSDDQDGVRGFMLEHLSIIRGYEGKCRDR